MVVTRTEVKNQNRLNGKFRGRVLDLEIGEVSGQTEKV